MVDARTELLPSARAAPELVAPRVQVELALPPPKGAQEPLAAVENVAASLPARPLSEAAVDSRRLQQVRVLVPFCW